MNERKPYKVCGTQPVVDGSGESVPPGETIFLTDEEAKFPLSIGAIEPIHPIAGDDILLRPDNELPGTVRPGRPDNELPGTVRPGRPDNELPGAPRREPFNTMVTDPTGKKE